MLSIVSRPLICLPVLLGLLFLMQVTTKRARSAPGGGRSLAVELARMRGEVETLSAKMEAQRSESTSQLQSLGRQKSELDAQLRREAVRVAELERRIAKWKAKIASRTERQEALRPVALQVAATLRHTIGETLPFALKERQQEIDKITDSLAKKLIAPGDAIARLWDRVEDELRLGRESGIFRQVIRIDGKDQLVEIARLGMVLLYFRTQDGRYGVLKKKSASHWAPTMLSTEAHRKQLDHLFESFRKQIRVGLFKLPNGLPPLQGGGQ